MLFSKMTPNSPQEPLRPPNYGIRYHPMVVPHTTQFGQIPWFSQVTTFYTPLPNWLLNVSLEQPTFEFSIYKVKFISNILDGFKTFKTNALVC